MKAMIFAAGLGTRLKPLTDTLPKALVPVCGKPLIHHVMEKLLSAQAPSGGRLIDSAVVNVHHFAAQIVSWLEESEYSERVHVSDETDLLRETGGGILHARPYLEGSGSFLVHNVDIISDLDLGWFVSQVHNDAMATLLVSERKTTRYLLFDRQDMRLKGWTNVTTGEVRSPYGNLNPDDCLHLAFSGIHLMSDMVFDVMDEYSSDERFPIIDFYLDAAARYPIYGVLAKDLHLIDVGKLDTLAEAERLCSEINDLNDKL